MTLLPFADLADFTRENEPMAQHTSFRVGGPVAYFIEPRTWDEFRAVYPRSQDAGLPIRVLGRGSNILVTDGPHPWVVVSTRRLHEIRREGNLISAGAGVSLPKLVAMAESCGLGGLEPLAGIPGSVGGAVAMNAGGRHGCVADRFVGGMVVAPGHMPRWAEHGEMEFDYRYSIVPKTHLLLLSATFELDLAAPRGLQAQRRTILAEKRATQPMKDRSAGCVFKNPPNLSAGKLIDQAGLKGTHVRGAAVSHKHANFIVNTGNATAADVLQLIDIVVQRVRDKFQVTLELELEIWDDQERK